MDAAPKPVNALAMLVMLLMLVSFTAAKVVVFFPAPLTSHIRSQTNVARATASLGHDVWMCVPANIAKKIYIDASGIKVITYGDDLDLVKNGMRTQSELQTSYFENKTQPLSSFWSMLSSYIQMYTSIIESDLPDRIKSVEPDLFVMGEQPSASLLVIPYKLGVPYAILGSYYSPLLYRIPVSPAATPFGVSTNNDQMDFLSRLKNTLCYVFVYVVRSLMEPDIVSMFAPEKPHKSVFELVNAAEVIIIEADHILDYPKPSLPNVKLVGGSVTTDAKPLKDPFKKFIDMSKKGVILVSFGSTLSRLPEYLFDKINQAGIESGLNVMWRNDAPSPEPDRIFTHHWIPQNDLMGHPNTKLFIGHCGKNGQYEALYHSVPILCLPIFGDQDYNAERARAKGFGLKADMRLASREELSNKIRELLTNSSYRTNLKKASRLLHTLYPSPCNETAFWVDHVMEFGGDYMRQAGQKMCMYQFLMLDVIGVVVVSVLAAGTGLAWLTAACRRRLVGWTRLITRSKSKHD